MQDFGASFSWDGDVITVQNKNYQPKEITIESDWSAASYWYSIIALSELGAVVKIQGLHQTSLQGDSVLKEIYKELGVNSTFENDGWRLEKVSEPKVEILNLDLNNAPDIAQTILCTCAGLGVGAKITGLHTLKIKETDRVEAMRNELLKFDVQLEAVNDDEVSLEANQSIQIPTTSIATYQDHRMAMAFAPLGLIVDFSIENEEVVSKSYPDFWKDLSSVLLIK